MRRVIMTGFCVGVVLGCHAQPSSTPVPQLLTRSHQAAVRSLLQAHPDLRLATAADNQSSYLNEIRRDAPGYQPYLAIGDLTGDGREDFAVALVPKEGAATPFHLFWWQQQPDGRYGAPQSLGKLELDSGGLFLREGELLAGDFFSDAGAVFVWDPARRAMRTEWMIPAEEADSNSVEP